MTKSNKQKELDEELSRECMGYSDRDNKPDGAYLKEGNRFFNLSKIKRLIEAGADVNAKRNNRWTPLHYASYYDSLEVVQFLLANGAEANAKDSSGQTPLHFATDNNRLKVAQVLLANGAEVDSKDKYGESPYDYAYSQEMKDLLKK